MGASVKNKKNNKNTHNKTLRKGAINKGGTYNRKRTNKKDHNKKTRKRYLQGGGWSLGNLLSNLPFGQDIVNVARSAENGVSNVVRGVGGYKKKVSQWPTSQTKLKVNAPSKRIEKNIAKLYKTNKRYVNSM